MISFGHLFPVEMKQWGLARNVRKKEFLGGKISKLLKNDGTVIKVSNFWFIVRISLSANF